MAARRAPRARSALLALPFLLAALAGCAQSSGAGALWLRQSADNAAQQWDPDAHLLQVSGLEANLTLPAASRAAMEKEADAGDIGAKRSLAALGDGYVGDGLAPVWAYAYLSPRGLFGVLVGEDRSVIASEQFANGTEAQQVIAGAAKVGLDWTDLFADWNIAADEASERLAAENATFAAMRGQPDLVAVWSTNPLHKSWTVLLAPTAGAGTTLSGEVSYVNGTVLTVRTFHAFVNVGYDVPKPPTTTVPVQPTLNREEGSVQLTVGATRADDASTFDLKSSKHKAGRFVFRASEALLGAGTVTVSATSPNGTVYSTPLSPGLSDDTFELDFGPERGTWAVAARAEGAAVSVAVTISWCTDGNPVSGASNPACQGFSGPSGVPPQPRFTAWGLPQRPFAAAP